MTIHNSNQKELHELAAGLLKEKVADEIILGSLKSRGVDSYYAEIILQNVKTDVEDRKQFWKHILIGTFVFLTGLTLTLGTYYLAEPDRIFYIFPGLMLVGIASIIRGFILFR